MTAYVVTTNWNGARAHFLVFGAKDEAAARLTVIRQSEFVVGIVDVRCYEQRHHHLVLTVVS